MKKIITLALGVAAMLTSCSKEEIGSSATPNTDQVIITLAAEDAVATRAASTAPTRYIAEAYSDATYTTPITISDSDSQIESTDGTFQVTIDRTKDYYFLFWSDVNGDDVYTTTSLTAVTLQSGETPVESWQGTAQILSGTAQTTLGVTLTRAVAKINLMETGALLENSSLVMTFDHNTVFDVSSGTVSTTASRTETIENESAISGSTTTAVQLNSSEIYLFAAAAAETSTVHNIIFTMNDETSFDVSNVPFQANHATNISGHYTKLPSETFTLSVDDTWATPDNDVDVDADEPSSDNTLTASVLTVQPSAESAESILFEWESSDTFTLYDGSGDYVGDFTCTDANSGIFGNENITLNGGESYTAIYPATTKATLDEALAEDLTSTQDGEEFSDPNRACMMKATFAYNASGSNKIEFNHLKAIMTFIFTSTHRENGLEELVFKNGDDEYTVTYDHMLETTTSYIMIEPCDGTSRSLYFYLTDFLGSTLINYTMDNFTEAYEAGCRYTSDFNELE